MATFPNVGSALETLQGYLQAALGSDAALRVDTNQDQPFVDVVLLSRESSEEERTGRAHLLLSATDEPAPAFGFDARRATVTASCRASEYAGAVVSTTRPNPIQETLARQLETLIETDYRNLRDIGLLASSTKRGRDGVLPEPSTLHFVDVAIQFVFFVS